MAEVHGPGAGAGKQPMNGSPSELRLGDGRKGKGCEVLYEETLQEGE